MPASLSRFTTSSFRRSASLPSAPSQLLLLLRFCSPSPLPPDTSEFAQSHPAKPAGTNGTFEHHAYTKTIACGQNRTLHHVQREARRSPGVAYSAAAWSARESSRARETARPGKLLAGCAPLRTRAPPPAPRGNLAQFACGGERASCCRDPAPDPAPACVPGACVRGAPVLIRYVPRVQINNAHLIHDHSTGRSSTRLHAPPGGGNQMGTSFGWSDAPAPVRRVFPTSLASS